LDIAYIFNSGSLLNMRQSFVEFRSVTSGGGGRRHSKARS